MSIFPWNKDYVKPPPERQGAISEMRAMAGRASVMARKNREDKLEKKAAKRAKDTAPYEGRDPQGPLYYLKDEDITHRQLEMVHRFIDAYLRTWSPGQAWLLANPGLSPSKTSATKAGMDLLQSDAVQCRLQAVVDAMDEEKLLSRKTVLMGLLREANHHGGDATHGGRIRAWMGLARIKEMDVQVTKTDVNIRGGVMIIPGTPDGQIIDVEAWEKSSEAQQLELKEEVRK